MESLSSRVDAPIVDSAEDALVGFAEQFHPAALGALGERILGHVAPEIAEEQEAAQLARLERRAHETRALTLTAERGTGRTRVSGWLSAEAAAIVAAALDPLTKPDPVGGGVHDRGAESGAGQTSAINISRAGASVAGACRTDPDTVADRVGAWHADADGSGGSCADASRADSSRSETSSSGTSGAERGKRAASIAADGVRSASGRADAAVRDPRTAAQRRADALVEVCRLALNRGELPASGGDRPQLTVTVNYDALAGELGAGMLDNGQTITPATVRRLACGAQIMPAVLGSRHEVVDVGRVARTWTGPARRAIVLRDGGCAFPGGDRPPRWCDVHHLVHWADGGRTDLDNGVLLCGFHHQLIHHTAWQVRMGADRRPEFIPPPDVDPLQRPRRNLYHHRE